MQPSRRVVDRRWWSRCGPMLLTGLSSASGLMLRRVGSPFTAPLSLAALRYAGSDACDPPARAVSPLITQFSRLFQARGMV